MQQVLIGEMSFHRNKTGEMGKELLSTNQVGLQITKSGITDISYHVTSMFYMRGLTCVKNLERTADRNPDRTVTCNKVTCTSRRQYFLQLVTMAADDF